MRTLPLRYTVIASLVKIVRTTQSNGYTTQSITQIGDYNVQKQELKGEKKNSLYGAYLEEIIRIYSVKDDLSSLLKSKMNNTGDNISNYRIYIDNKKYSILNVFDTYIDIKYEGNYETYSI